MTMTQFGKLLVVFNVVLSLVFLAWAAAVYTEHVDWVTPAGGGADQKGRLEQLKEEITALDAERNRVFARWHAVNRSLAAAEADRQPRRDWYAEQLKVVETGTDTAGNKVEPPVRELPPEVDGLVAYRSRAPRKPITYNGQPLQSLTYYGEQLVDRDQKVKEGQALVQKLIDEQKVLTEKLNGSPAIGKGLRDLFGEQVAAAQASADEQEYLRGQVANRKAEEQLMLKRYANMEARVKFLKEKLGMVSGRRRAESQDGF
jgi:hypothetical protein